MNQIEDYTNRPKRYFNIDGLGEVSSGLIAVGFALIIWFRSTLPRDSFWNGGLALHLLVLPMILLIYYGTIAVKKHVTYPRTGSVDYPLKAFVVPFYQDTLALIILVAALLASFAVLIFAPGLLTSFLRPSFDFSSLAWVYGIVLAVVYASRIAGRIRWKWIVALVIASGSLAISMLSTGVYERWLRLIVFLGVTFLISGGISFYLYLRRTQHAARTAE